MSKRRKGREEYEARAQKKERREIEAARRDSLADEEVCRIRVVESAAGASSSRNMEIAGGTTNSVVDAVDTTEGVQITEVAGSGEPNPGNRTHQLTDRERFAPEVCFTYHSRISNFLCIGDNCMSFCWGWGK